MVCVSTEEILDICYDTVSVSYIINMYVALTVHVCLETNKSIL